ncbi:MAG: LysR family transcriptional regulator [Deltaproteobacteria bacterium]|nr:LysR family transcriptional regulator [Deltaproteobacteria bacterium]
MFPDFNRLKVFHHVYANNSVAAAARELCVTQSAVSQHLNKLETEIDTLLFTRVGKRLVPTRAGERLFDVLSPFIGELVVTLDNIDKEREGPFGLLRIGAPSEFGTSVLPEIIASFRTEYPGVRFHLELGHPKALLPLLEQGRIDFAFADIFLQKGQFSREYAHFSIDPIMKEELVLVCSKRYNKKHLKEDYSFSTLGGARFVSYQEDASALGSWFRHHFNKPRLALDIVLSVESVQGVIAGVRNHMGLGVVPRHIVDSEIKRGRIVQISTSKKEIVHRVSLVQLQDKIPRMAEKVFIRFAKAKMNRSIKTH